MVWYSSSISIIIYLSLIRGISSGPAQLDLGVGMVTHTPHVTCDTDYSGRVTERNEFSLRSSRVPNPAHLDLFSTGTGTGTTWNFYRPVLPGTSTDWLYYQYRYYRLTDWLYYRLPVLPVYSLVILVTDYRFAD